MTQQSFEDFWGGIFFKGPDAIRAAIDTLEDQGRLCSEDLGILVHDLHAEEAARVNNGGLQQQIAYLCVALGYKGMLDGIRAIIAHKEEVQNGG